MGRAPVAPAPLLLPGRDRCSSLSNGAGKTTVFNLISGFLHGSGHIYFNNKRIDGLPPHRVTHLGLARTFQIPQPFHSMTVVQNLRIGEYYGADRKRGAAKCVPWSDLRDLISFVGLEGKEDSPVLASALATKPRLIMLDEALGGLSAVEAEQSLELLRRLNTEWGLTVLMIEHLMSALTRSCHRLLILNNGEALALGEAKAVVEEPAVVECLVGGKHA